MEMGWLSLRVGRKILEYLGECCTRYSPSVIVPWEAALHHICSHI